jgi:hypothetical protein
MRKLFCIAVVAAIPTVAVQGCGGSVCDYQKACPNDPMPTQSQIESQVSSCKAHEQDISNQPCFGEREDWLGCLRGQAVCTAAGTTDFNASVQRAQVNCSNQYGNLTACCLRNSNSQACKA